MTEKGLEEYLGCMKKKFLIFIFAILAGVEAFCYDGLMNGESKIFCKSTKWFDIIYPYECSESAMILFEKADGIYEEMAEFYGRPIVFRLPVVLTRQTELFNAYFNFYPFCRIVLQDAVPDQSFVVNEDSLIDCFKHELNHAYTLTMANDYMTQVSSVMGNFYSGAGSTILITSFMAEGASVFYESQGSSESGRLNDSYYLASVRQSKISGEFPDWSDVLGAMSIFPGARTCYSYGGPFTEYLVNSYGMEKYADLWYRCVNVEKLFFSKIFKDVYGVSLNSAWKDFVDSLYVPEVAKADPREEAFVRDFFVNDKNISEDAAGSDISGRTDIGGGSDISGGKNNCASRFEDLSSFKGGFVFVDKSYGGVFRVLSDGSVKKLFSDSKVCDANASADGSYVVLTYIDSNGNADTYKLSVFSVSDNSTLWIDEEGLRDGSLIFKDGKYWLCSVKVEGANSSVKIFEALMNSKNEICGFKEAGSFLLDRNSSVFNIEDIGGGKVAMIYKEGIKWSIRVYNDFIDSVVSGNDVSFAEYSLQDIKEGKAFRIKHLNLSEDGSRLIFSYGEKDSLPRYGELIISDGEEAGAVASSVAGAGVFRLMKKNVSGGVQFPVEFNGNICYSGDFVFHKDLLSLDQKNVEYDVFKVPSKNGIVLSDKKHKADENKEAVDSFVASSSVFSNIYKYKGFFIPFSTVAGFGITQKGSFDTASYIPLGLTYVTGDPWGGSVLYVSGLTDFFMNKYGVGVTLSGGTDSGSFTYSDNANIIFDSKGFNQVSNSVLLNLSHGFSHHGSLSLYAKNGLFFGRNYHDISKLASWQETFSDIDICKLFDVLPMDERFFFTKSTLGMEVSGIHKSGPGVNEYLGVGAGVEYYLSYYTFMNSNDSSKVMQLFPYVEMSLPKLIPVDYFNGITLNLPVSALAGVYPDGNTVLYGNAECLLFGWQIEKGLGYFPFYLNSFNIKAGYTAQFVDLDKSKSLRIQYIADDFKNFDNLYYYDCLTISLLLKSSLNVGFAARISGAIQLYSDFNVYFHDPEKNFEFKPGIKFNI